MSFRRNFKLAAIAISVLAFAQFAYGQTNGEGKLANMTVGANSVRWDITASNSGGSVTIQFPDGRSVRRAFRGGASPEFDLSDKQLESLPDGVYNYDLRLAPALTDGQKETLMKARGSDDEPEAQRNLRKRPALPFLTQTGSFALANGALVGPGGIEAERTGSTRQPQPKAQPATVTRVSANTIDRLRNHRFSLAPDIVQADDVIIQGSLCVGLDCVVNESFGFDTIRLKENNTRIKFDDTSTSAGFPANDWQITANDSASGGSSKFSIEDITGSKVPFTITAGASTNSIFVDSTGRLGLRTSTPVLDIHANTSNTPAMRFEQNNSGGFTAQTWDVAGNEANFFVRDVTGGSRLPFRIRPGAPTSSIDVAASGNVGIGTASPTSPNGFTHSMVISATGSVSTVFNDGTNTFELGVDTGHRFRIIGSAAGNVLTGDTNGNVGIGTTAPDQKLSVNGDADKVGGGSWLSFSDERLKNIKGRFNTGLKAVMQLNPIRYEYLKNNALGLMSNGDHIGFGAQSLQKVIPEAVTTGSDGFLRVNNDPILWTMLNAIKEQQKEIESLKSQVEKLKATSHRRSRNK
jgi:hypothetical protein